MRAIWTGAIGFGLVNIPVKLYSATQGSELDLDMLDKKDHAKIHFKRVNENTGKEVAWENIVRGYYLNNKYVVLTDQDFQKASPEKSKTINIDQFVDASEVDSIYYESPYYLAPEKSGVRAYALLREALRKSGKAGLGTYVLRNKEVLGLIMVRDDVLVLNKIRFAQEIRDTGELDLPDVKPKPNELKMATALIDQLTAKFDIRQYKDTYSEQLLKFIKARAKGKGKEKEQPVMRVVHSRTNDLMSQLKDSLSTKPHKRKAS
jgi:DNA end-binding protein Ku